MYVYIYIYMCMYIYIYIYTFNYAVYPFLESDTLFLEGRFVLFLVV